MIVHVQTLQPTSSVALPITIELHITRGIRWHMTGALHHSIKENQKRVYTAVKNCGWHWPGQRINTNFIPLDQPKMGTHYDLPLAIGILAGSGQIPKRHLPEVIVLGALELEGALSAITCSFASLQLAQKLGKNYVMACFEEEEYHKLKLLFPEITLLHVNHFREVTRALSMNSLDQFPSVFPTKSDLGEDSKTEIGCFTEVLGQGNLKRMLEVAAAGGHHALMIGPPGAGKTMLAERYAGILPVVNPKQQATVRILNGSGQGSSLLALNGKRPMKLCFGASRKDLFGALNLQRWNHIWKTPVDDTWEFMAKDVGLKGELGLFQQSLGGTLFLDEFITYPKAILDVLLHHSDPHQVQLLLAMNPCSCGNFNHPTRDCHCSAASLHRYQGKMTGAWKDRIEMIQYSEAVEDNSPKGETSEDIRTRVMEAWNIQMARQGTQNAQLHKTELLKLCSLSKSTQQNFSSNCVRYSLSLRAQTGILSVARTLADLDATGAVQQKHMDEAFHLRLGNKEALGSHSQKNNPPKRKIRLGADLTVKLKD